MEENKSLLRSIIPSELLEPNWRLWSFVILIVASMSALIVLPVKSFDGYVDPFYSPTVLLVPVAGLLRLTCYAFRKNYHRHLFKHPLDCTTSARGDSETRSYSGETKFFRLENAHRYFVYAGIAILPFFYYDMVGSITYAGGLTLRLGSVLMAAEVVALTLWLASCHSIRHLVGGRTDCYGCEFAGNKKNAVWRGQSYLNRHHELLAWAGLILIVAVDLYLRGLAAGMPIDATILRIV